MAKLVLNQSLHLLFFMGFLLLHNSEQLQSSEIQALVKIQQLINYPSPSPLSSWNDITDFCSAEPNTSLTLVCYENNITQLHITGSNNGLTLNFSTTSFLFSTLASLPSLKVLSLVSLGLLGPLPASIGTLSSLEILNISSNYFIGTIPVEVSYLRNLQTLILDHNRFTGEAPDWLSSLPVLTVLSLKNNSLSGSLPKSFSRLETLRILVLSMNHLSGEVPDFRNLTNLQEVDLEDNTFGPHFPNLHCKLITIVLRRNRFRFGIPAELSSYYQLQKLDVSLNEFDGPFLVSLLSLPWLTYLNIAGNKFTGMLFKNTSCNAELAFVNLSSNYLTGDLPTCLMPDSGRRVVVGYAGNCLWNSGRGDQVQEQLLYSFCLNQALAVKILPLKQKEKPPYGKAGTVVGLVGGIALLGLVFLVIRKREHAHKISKTPHTSLITLTEKVSPAYTLKLLTVARYISETRKLGPLGIPAYRTFVLEEIKEATNNFDTSNLMGEGSHGQVYKGQLTDGTLAAIRSLKMRKKYCIQTYTHQIELISRLRNCHIVSAIGHCFECYPDDSSVSGIFLVFEFVPNGTLRGCISEGLPGQNFTWTQRLAAAVGVVRGIQFLHSGIVPGVYSNNLKITDILLDHNLHVKISRYNLPLLVESRRLVGAGVSSTGQKDSVRTRLNYEDKNDVYDLGVILLEIVVGRAIVSETDISVVKDLLQVSLTTDDVARRSIVDTVVHKECSDESLKTLMELCVRCLSIEPIDRPSVEDVLWNLQFIAQVQDSQRGDSKSNQGSPIMCKEW